LRGIQVVKSANVQVSQNQIRDFSNGTEATGIGIEDSPIATVNNNTVERANFGITVRNNGGAGGGGQFDSSNTSVIANTMSDILVRAMKLQASQNGSLRLRNLVVTDNWAPNFGNTGLYLVGGVTKALIQNNTFSGGPGSTYALWIGSINVNEPLAGLNPSFDNQVETNVFKSSVFDVSFNGSPTGNNAAGPDQISISRLSAGSNTLLGTGIEPTPSQKCGQFAHAWWAYENGLNYVPSGGRIILAAAGVRQLSTVTYHIRTPSNPTIDLMTFTTALQANSQCVVNQHDSPLITLAPGLYDVYVDLTDGNARYPDAQNGPGVPINNWKLDVKLDVR
jgi:hypothetical protein